MKTSRIAGVVLASLLQASLLPAAIVINEIHYNPDVKTDPGEFIELYNTGPAAVNLAGWQFTDGIQFTFPSTNVPAGGFVVVAQSPAFLQTKYGAAGALGPFNPDFSSGLSSRGERLTLRDSSGQVVDEVDFRLGFPWPTVGDSTVPGNGNSIELINPALDNDLGGSWRGSGGGARSAAQNTTLLPAQATWKYFKGTSEASSPATAWRQSNFIDETWQSGVLPIGYGEAFIATSLTDMNNTYASVFLRKQFTVTNPAEFTRLLLAAQYDDGFKAWINGTLVIDNQANMPAGEVPFNGSAVSALENLNFVTNILTATPSTLLVPGVNTLAIQAHNSAISGSSDFFFDCHLIGQAGGSSGTGPSPGRINTVFADNAPPQPRQVEHSPNEPVAGQPVRITAKVTDPDGVGSVTLQYQVVLPGQYIELTDAAYTNAANWVSLAMNDAGLSGDLTAGDDVYSAEIPSSVQAHRRLIRYRMTVTDTGGRSIRVPYADDPQPNFAYFVYNGVPGWRAAIQPGAAGGNGAVLDFSSNTMSRLPAMHLIGRSNSVATATWFSRYAGDAYQWQGTLIYDGKVYDHIRYRARGGVWRYSMVKNMWKFDMNRGHDFEAKDNWGRKYSTPWTKVNLGACIQQGDFNHRGEQGMFESVGFRLFQLAGVAAPHTSFGTFRVIDDALEADPATQYEGDFWGFYLLIEQENGRFLEEHGLPDGNLYKMESGTGELNNLGPNGPSNKSDLNYVLQNYTGATDAWWRTNWNLPKYYSYQTIVQAIHHFDISDGKNYFYYRNPESRLWEVASWDLDLTWAHNMYRSDNAGCGVDEVMRRLISPIQEGGTGPQAGTGVIRLNGTRPAIELEFRNRVREIRDLLFNTNEAWRLIDEYAGLARGPTNVPTILDADRMMWDYNPKMNNGSYTPNLGKAGQGRFYQFPSESATNATLRGSFDATVRILKHYVGIRSALLDSLATDNSKPATPSISYTGPSGYPINRLTFRSSPYSGVNAFGSLRWRVGEITDPNSPNYRPDEPQKYEIETVWDSGPISPFASDITVPANVMRTGSRYRVRVQHTDVTGRTSHWSPAHEFVCGQPENSGDLLDNLRITEIMYNPPAGGFEFIELQNISSSVTLDLAGVKFTQGIDFTFPPGTTLPPGAYIVVIGTTDLAGFRAYYGIDDSVSVVGPYSGSLNNAGEQLVLRTAAGGSDIVNLSYGDGRGWPATADGTGHSIVLLDAALSAQGSGAGDFAGNWRSSTYLRGSPGSADVAPVPGVLLNEIVAHTDFTGEFDSNDWIELFNPTPNPLVLGSGWYLSDDGSTYASLKKWAIPAGTTLPAHGWVSFDEVTGFHNPTNTGFGLDKSGEQVFLSFLPGTSSDRVVDAVSFKGQENDWSLGRYPDGSPYWHALNPRTRNTANAAPEATVVFSEVMFHPSDLLVGTNVVDNGLDEFIELYNASSVGVELSNSNGAWRLNGGINYVLPANISLAPDERLLIVNFDPQTNATQLAAFKNLYNISNPTLRTLGPYQGKLGNSSGRIALEKPQAPDAPGGTISWIIVDEMLYSDQSPWPCGADGSGNSLQRLSATRHGSDPLNWASEPPTAGSVRADLPPGLPAITAQPQDRVAPTNGTVTFSVSVCGTPPFTYRWRFANEDIAEGTNSTLTLTALTAEDSGEYTVVVSNAAGSVISEPATLIVQFPPVITIQPVPTTTIRDQSASFSVTAGGTAPIFYQWRFNGANLLGETNRHLSLVNVQASQAGNYSVLVYNTAGSIASSNAVLTVLIPATITAQPTNLTVRVTTFPSNATFSVTAVGTGTLRYQWRHNGIAIPDATSSSHTIQGVQVADEGEYTVVVTDNIGPAVSQPAILTVLVTPTVLVPPLSQSAVAGTPVTLSVTIAGNPKPFIYEWRRGSVSIWTNVSDAQTDFFTVNANSEPGTSNNYRVAIRNLASPPAGVPSAFAYITSLADWDNDGLPDSWETAYGFSTNNAADAALDSDGDKMKNRDEYIAGTDPSNPSSYLRVEEIAAIPGAKLQVRIEFSAVSNHTYSVQANTNSVGGAWMNVSNVGAASTDRAVTVMDERPPGSPRRFYRLVTPKAP